MTEDEAKTKWCPFTRFHSSPSDDIYSNRLGGRPIAECIASECMAWRWQQDTRVEIVRGEYVSKNPLHGYCGLAGKP